MACYGCKHMAPIKDISYEIKEVISSAIFQRKEYGKIYNYEVPVKRSEVVERRVDSEVRCWCKRKKGGGLVLIKTKCKEKVR